MLFDIYEMPTTRPTPGESVEFWCVRTVTATNPQAALTAAFHAATFDGPNAGTRWVAIARENLEELTAEYVAWLDEHNLPQLSADEHDPETLTADQRAYLSDFVTRWESAEK